MRIAISEITYTPASRQDRGTGLLGFITFVINGALKIDGITLRRTRSQRLTLSYPARRDRSGAEHFVIKPLGDEARLQIEKQVFESLAAEVAS